MKSKSLSTLMIDDCVSAPSGNRMSVNRVSTDSASRNMMPLRRRCSCHARPVLGWVESTPGGNVHKTRTIMPILRIIPVLLSLGLSGCKDRENNRGENRPILSSSDQREKDVSENARAGRLPEAGAVPKSDSGIADPTRESRSHVRSGAAGSDDLDDATALPPDAVIRKANRLRRAGRLVDLESLIVKQQASYVVDLIGAVDMVATADNRLQQAISSKLGSHTARHFRHGEIVNAIGPFSRDVSVVDTQQVGDEIHVTVQVAGRVPLETTTLVREENRWKIRTDEPIPGVIDALGDLARVLRETAGRLESAAETDLTATRLRRELDARLQPILDRIAQLTDQ